LFNNEIEGASNEMAEEEDEEKSLETLYNNVELVILIRNLSFDEQLYSSI
jgi:hypothetical protein